MLVLSSSARWQGAAERNSFFEEPVSELYGQRYNNAETKIRRTQKGGTNNVTTVVASGSQIEILLQGDLGVTN
jgi:hypothetical protein